jgi:hypothetical protein
MDTDLGYIHTKFQPLRAIRLSMAGKNVVMSRYLQIYPIVPWWWEQKVEKDYQVREKTNGKHLM